MPIFVLVAALVPFGCTGEPLPPLGPVKGHVTLAGKPLTSGNVVLHPVTAPVGKVLLTSGQIDADGNYEIFTGGKAGAPLGKYKVIVTPAMMPAEQGKGGMNTAFDKKYLDRTKTPFEFDVVANPEDGRYDLKLKK